MTSMWWFPVVALLAVVPAVIARASGRREMVEEPEALAQDPELVAHLVGGPDRVFVGALTRLRGHRLVARAGRGSLRATGSATDLTAVQQAILQATSTAQPVEAVRTDPGVLDALEAVSRRSSRTGLVRSTAQLTRIRVAALLPVAVSVLGVFLLSSGDLTGGDAVAVAVSTAILVVAALLLLFPRRRTGLGSRTLRVARGTWPHLDPVRRPAWRTYGPAGMAMGVALYGSVAFHDIDPAFARGTELLPRPQPVGDGAAGGGDGGVGAWSSDHSSGGGDSGGSCGGGGCGSS